MKVAIILYGQTRNLHISTKSWVFDKMWDCHYFISTWSVTKQFSDRMKGLQFIKNIDEEYIKNCLPNSTIQILDEEKIVIDNNNLNTNANKSLFHIKNAFEMVKNSLENYDFVLLTRSDQYFTFGDDLQKFDLSQYKNCETIFGTSPIIINNGENHINDIFFFGSFGIMELLIKNLNYEENNGLHKYFADKFINLNIKVEPNSLGLSNVTVRPNALELKEFEINFDTLNQKSIKW